MDPALQGASTWEPDFGEIFDFSLDLLCIAGFDGYFKRVNPAFEEAFGYTSEELLSRPFLDFVHREDRARASGAFEELLSGREVLRFENRNICADGSTLWLEWSSRPVPGERIFYGAARDITDRKHAEQRLREVREDAQNSRDELRQHAEELEALRRLATLVAGGASSDAMFDAVAQEVVQVLYLSNAAVCRYDDGGATMTVLAVSGVRPDPFAPGSRWPLDGPSMSAEVLRTGRPVRIEDYTDLSGSLGAAARESGFDQVAGAPIIVDGRVWGLISTSSPDAQLPDDLEDRLGEFTKLVATAIANSDAREELARLAEEQAALRRVATLVARGIAPADLFEAVSAEVAQLIPADGAALTRFEPDGTVTALGGWTTAGGYVYSGRRFDLDGTVSGRVLDAGGPARIDDYTVEAGTAAVAAREMGWRTSVGAPVILSGRLWGVLAVVSKDEPLPPDTERRLVGFTELLATAVANTESGEERARLTAEHAALRRIATLVADGAPPDDVFTAIGDEVSRTLGVPIAVMFRYEADGGATVLASSGADWVSVGSFWPNLPGGVPAAVLETGRAARVDDWTEVTGPAGDLAREHGLRWGVGVPIVVDGSLWGAIIALSRDPEPLAKETEPRLTAFTELLATAISNSESRAELEASRARIVATADATRRRIERDLHDGAQQQLVALALEARAAQAAVPAELGELRSELSGLVEGLTGALDGLREIALGIHPAILVEGGLAPALKTLARRSPVPVKLEVSTGLRLPEPVEVAAYYVVSEALTNTAKHANASVVHVGVEADDGILRVSVSDDGVGGADAAHGSGLVGLKDRAEAIGGRILLDSAPGGGTSVEVELPLAVHRH
jgi:PAS domain S-box-containing protein